MKKISLICSFHGERGITNISELHGILERIQPEVIFLEVPAEWRGNSGLLERTNNLESNAVARYVAGHPAELIPVDLPTPEEAFFRKARNFFEEIEKHSYEYCRLVDQSTSRMGIEGFAYLNSESNNKYHSDVHSEIVATIENGGRKWLAEYYSEWCRVMEQRDIEMLKNIYLYCRDHEFEKAVFLVGAAHRASIIVKSGARSLSGSAEVQWEYLSVLPHNKSLKDAP